MFIFVTTIFKWNYLLFYLKLCKFWLKQFNLHLKWAICVIFFSFFFRMKVVVLRTDPMTFCIKVNVVLTTMKVFKIQIQNLFIGLKIVT